MIEVTITSRGGTQELCRIRLINTETYTDGTADYSVEFAVERGGAVGLHRRSLHRFPRGEYNVLALLKQALETLDESELELENGIGESDMAGGLQRALQTLQSEQDPFSDY